MTKRAGLVPQGFLFGVATAGYQIEGGYNGRGEPRNNWYGWEASGRVEPSGTAIGFWDRYEEHLDLVAGLGCDSFRMSVEWARIVPEQGHVDERAVARYRAILRACADRQLTPLVTLHHYTHPWWLGESFWLRPDAPERFCEWARLALDHLGDLCTHWVTTNECNALAIQSFLLGTFPPGKLGALADVVTALDHLVAGHVLAYDAIKSRNSGATVATNNFSLSVYEFDRLPLDLLLARGSGIGRRDLAEWLAERRSAHYLALGLSGTVRGGVEWALRRVAAGALPLDRALPRTTAAVYASKHDRLLDVAQLDYYVPRTSEHFAVPGHRTSGNPRRAWGPTRDLWDDRPDPAGFSEYLRLAATSGLDVWVVENGMCNRVRRGRSYPRLDGWTRDRYLRENLAALVGAIDAAVPVTGYWHWTLADNYEWGTYEPRFGLYGVDRDRGIVLTRTDAMGIDSAPSYTI